jgi:hypothetical protein
VRSIWNSILILNFFLKQPIKDIFQVDSLLFKILKRRDQSIDLLQYLIKCDNKSRDLTQTACILFLIKGDEGL